MITHKKYHRNCFRCTCCYRILISCERSKQATESTQSTDIPQYQFEATGEDYLISALDEAGCNCRLDKHQSEREENIDLAFKESKNRSREDKHRYNLYLWCSLPRMATEQPSLSDTHILKVCSLITVRKSYGKENGHVVTETKRYISHSDFLIDNPQQSNITEVFGLSRDTIVTHVTQKRNA